MSVDIRKVKDMNGLITYLAEKLSWKIDLDDFDDIEDIAYDFEAEDIGLKEEAFVKIQSLRQLPPLVDGQKWGIFCVEFDSKRFEITALRKILSGLIPKRRNSADHAVWDQKDLLFICFWGSSNERTIGLAHFEDAESGLPQIKMISCCPAVEDFTQIKVFEDRLKNLKWPANYVDHNKWQEDWSNAFTIGYKQTIRDASTLTAQLAIVAQGIRNRILEILEVETTNGYVHLLYEKFKNTLIHDMTEVQFADMYAQTVVYGLFSARCMDETQDDFSAAEAVDCIPNTNPFLKNLMKECLGSQNNSKLSFDELEIGNVVDLLLHTKTDAIIQDFNRQTGGGKEDPVIHFYEEFLTAYDKSQRVQRGVYYTPQPVVNFIVRSVDHLIKRDFGYKEGLASIEKKKIKIMRQSKRRVDGFYYKQIEDTEEVPAIQILDPSTGTGTFVRQIILQIYKNVKEQNKRMSSEEFKKYWNEYVPNHLLPRLNAFELMMAPYAVAHMKLAMVLKDTGYDFGSESRLNVYLTNTLEKPGNSDGQLTLWDDPLAAESIEANRVKKNSGLSVVIGNPPYSNSSSNRGEWIQSLLTLYKEGLNERKLNLDEDSIKFIRFGHYLAEKNDRFILAYISNNSFVNGVTHRKMRSELMQTFDKIYILNLHGDSNRIEKAPDGSKDENVFDIQQGVSINIFVKSTNNPVKRCDVYYADLYGLQKEKLTYLQSMDFEKVSWEQIQPMDPYFFFDNKDYSGSASYEEGFSVSDLFIEKNTGIQTKNDSLALQISEEKMQAVVQDFITLSPTDIKKKYGIKEGGTWTVENAKADLLRGDYKIIPVLFRPFDTRYTVLTDKSSGFLGRPRYSTMKQMTYDFPNYALLVGRQNKSSDIDSFLVTDLASEMKCAERTIQSYHLPIFVAEFDMVDRTFHPKANFTRDIVEKICNQIGMQFDWYATSSQTSLTAYDVLCYIYACLYSCAYREKYRNQLKIDFPRIPYPKNKEMFMNLKIYGNKLIDVHLMHKPVAHNNITYVIGNNAIIDAPKYKDGTVSINKEGTKVINVPIEAWEMGIGGYAPLQKWLKDRRGWSLTKIDLEHFCDTTARILITREIMDEIDHFGYFS